MEKNYYSLRFFLVIIIRSDTILKKNKINKSIVWSTSSLLILYYVSIYMSLLILK